MKYVNIVTCISMVILSETEAATLSYCSGNAAFTADEFAATDTVSERNADTSSTGYAFSPIIGYDPSLGTILGGAIFMYPLEPPGQYFDLQVQTLLSGTMSMNVHYVYDGIAQDLSLSLSGSYSGYVQYYFGEGDATDAEKFDKLYAHRYSCTPELSLCVRSDMRINLFADLRGAKELKVTDKNDLLLKTNIIPDRTITAVGTSVQYDTRGNLTGLDNGLLGRISIQYLPEGKTVQYGGEIRNFFNIYGARYRIASRVAAGFSTGNPEYLFRYSLGGSYALRGFYENRFRGKNFYSGQIEARLPLYGRFSTVVFVDGGDVSERWFVRCLSTYGGGLRFALRNTITLRFDYGIAKDQSGIFFTFGEAF